MAESTDWESLNLDLLVNLPPDRPSRVTFQTVQSKTMDDIMPIILSGFLKKVYQDDKDQWYVDVLVDGTSLVTDRKLRDASIGRIVRALVDGDDLPATEGVIEEPLEPQIKSFLLSDVVAPVITVLPE